jgi:hypothetical protein
MGDQAPEGVAPADLGEDEAYHTVWVASYLDEPPAQNAAAAFRAKGLLAFTVKKTLVEKEKSLFRSKTRSVGDFYLVNVGLFGNVEEAQILGRRLLAQGQIGNWRVIGSADPGEIARLAVQAAPVVTRSVQVSTQAQKTAGRPMSPQAPAVTGQGFKNLIHGRYVGSFKDLREAKAEAERLSAAGWPAAVERATPKGGNWFRVYLTEATDHRDFEASPRRLARDKAEAATQSGLFFLVDLSGQAGAWGQVAPGRSRLEASACAGYSRPGRVLTGLERVIGQIPDNSPLIVGVKSVSYAQASGLVEKTTRKIKTWWTEDETELTETKNAIGPTYFNRPLVTRAIRSLKLDSQAVSLAPAFDGLYEPRSVPGQKTVLVWSDLRWAGSDSEVLAALGRLKAQWGGQADILVIYGDVDDRGWRLAENLARTGGGTPAYDGCLLLTDQSYFQSFVNRALKKS